LITEPHGASTDPPAAARVTLLGLCRRIPEEEVEAARAAYLAAHPGASRYAGFKDFAYYRVEPVALRYVGSFGRMAWVDAEAYKSAEPDPIAPRAARIIGHMNRDHADALLAYAQKLSGVAGASASTMTGVDRYGFDMSVTTPEGARSVRLAWSAPVSTADDVRRAMIDLARAAGALGDGSAKHD
jgi:putative heme iron utilization protein